MEREGHALVSVAVCAERFDSEFHLHADSQSRGIVLGQALRRAVASYTPDFRVAVIGTGGLSHQLHGERFGFRNEAWDMEFLDLLERNPESLAALRLQDYIERGGAEGAEVIMWLAMRGALSPKVRRLHRNYHGPLHTGFAQVIFEDAAYTPPPGGTP